MLISIISGIAAGSAHVIAGPDHLAAVAPFAVDNPQRAASIGFRWGLGHGLAVVILGGLGLLAADWLNVDLISSWSEFFVGFVLIVVGFWALRRASRVVAHSHPHRHSHDENEGHTHSHQHFHIHASAENHDSLDAHKGHSHAAFAVGFLHGAAGTGHLLGVLPSLALPPAEAVAYLIAYFLSAVGAMTGFGVVMGFIAGRHGPALLRGTMYASSGAAILVGCLWITQSWPI